MRPLNYNVVPARRVFRHAGMDVISYIFIIITLIERVLGELIFIYYGMLLPNVSSIF